MNPGWRILDLTSFTGTIRYVRGRLLIQPTNGEKELEVPLSQIAVALIGVSASVSGAVIAKLAEYDAVLMVCDWKGMPTAALFPWSDHTRVGARQIAQARLSVPRAKSAWSSIIRSKIRGQANNLGLVDSETKSKLLTLARTVRSGDPDNHEAQAARLYWDRFPGSTGFRRLGGTGIDLTNSALDYGYTILRGHGIRAVLSAGLVPTVGVFHKGRSNPFNLVDDLIEPFRPAIDSAVARMSLENLTELDSDLKRALVSAADAPFLESGESISTVFQSLAQQFGQYVEGEVTNLEVPYWKGPFDAKEG